MRKIGIGLMAAMFLAGLISAQSKDETQIREILKQNTDSFAKNDMSTLDKICFNGESVTVFENGYAD